MLTIHRLCRNALHPLHKSIISRYFKITLNHMILRGF